MWKIITTALIVGLLAVMLPLDMLGGQALVAARDRTVKNGESIQDAIDKARPGDTIIVYPTDDSYTDQRIRYRSYGRANTLWAYNSTSFNRYMWLKFDVSGCLEYRITSAEMVLHVNSSWGFPWTSDRVFGAYVGEDGWDEASINWINQPGIGAIQQDQVKNPTRASAITFNVMDATTGESATDETLTLVIKSEKEAYSDFLSVYSKENQEERCPILVIQIPEEELPS